jgi:hypothetical protein
MVPSRARLEEFWNHMAGSPQLELCEKYAFALHLLFVAMQERQDEYGDADMAEA